MPRVNYIRPGVYAPALTFFKHESQDLDLDAFTKHVIYMAEAGVGPVVCGSMSEAPLLSESERLQLVSAARAALDSIDAPFPLIVGTGLASTRETIDLTNKVTAAGADIAIVIASGYYASLMTPTALKRFYIDVAKQSPIPVLMYNFPNAAGGLDMDSNLIEQIATEATNICGAKLTCSQIGKITRLASNLNTAEFEKEYPRSWKEAGSSQPSFVVLAGFSDLMVPSLFAKAHGSIAGIGNFAPRALHKLFDLAYKATSGSAQDVAAAQELQTLMSSADYQTTLLHIPGAKQILQDRKGYGGVPREPIQPIDKTFYEMTMKHPAVVKLFALEDELEQGGKAAWQTTISPVDQSAVVKRQIPTTGELESALARADAAFASYKTTTLDERIAIAEGFLDQLAANKDKLSQDLALQIGRPVPHCAVEVDGAIHRGRHMISIARDCLADSDNKDTDKPDHVRFIKRVPLGVVLVISPWNYPWFCQINAVLPALLAGNTVLLKPSPQTPLCGEHFADAYAAAGLPAGCLQVLHSTPEQVTSLIKDSRVQFVMFTGSVANGHAITKAASDSFKGVGLELGGKDPAYVMADVNVEKAVPALVDAAFFNAGQSCCSVERIYVHKDVYDEFVKKFTDRVKMYKLGSPSSNSTMGPVVSRRSADFIRSQVAQAVAAGAKALIPADLFPIATGQDNYVAPQVLVDVDHSMSIMVDETFGPVVGIMKVSSNAEAVKLMNDSPFGLTASVWTSSSNVQELLNTIQAGTVYVNNADNLDPALAWSGWKDSGRGVSLSKFGFDAFTRTKSISLKSF